jgi:hypothetical protein
MNEEGPGSKYYGVLTLGRGNRVEQASRTGDDYAVADLCDEEWTYRMELCEGEVAVARIRKRWRAADATPDVDWELLYETPEEEEE